MLTSTLSRGELTIIVSLTDHNLSPGPPGPASPLAPLGPPEPSSVPPPPSPLLLAHSPEPLTPTFVSCMRHRKELIIIVSTDDHLENAAQFNWHLNAKVCGREGGPYWKVIEWRGGSSRSGEGGVFTPCHPSPPRCLMLRYAHTLLHVILSFIFPLSLFLVCPRSLGSLASCPLGCRVDIVTYNNCRRGR